MWLRDLIHSCSTKRWSVASCAMQVKTAHDAKCQSCHPFLMGSDMSSQGLSSCDIRVCQHHSAGPFLVPFKVRFQNLLVQGAAADDMVAQ
jgi:hypothetical protein